MQSIGAGANDTLLIDDRTVVRTPGGTPATIVNLGAAQTNVGTDTQVGNIWSVGPIVVRDRARVAGSIHGQHAVTVAPTASVNPGPTVANTPFTLDTVSWTVTFPSPTGDVILQPNATRTLSPGSYGAVTVQPTAKLTLTPGTYFFQSLDFESRASVSLDDRNGPITIYVANSVIYRGTVSDTANTPANILMGFAGTAPVAIEASFLGTFVAPSARVTVGSLSHRGAFFAKGLEIYPGATVMAQASSFVPNVEVVPGETVKVTQPVYLTVRSRPPGFGAPLTYTWTVTTTPPGLHYTIDRLGSTANFTPLDPGDFTVTIAMTDPSGRTGTSRVPIHVLDAPIPDRPDRLNLDALTRPCRSGDETLPEFAARCDKAMNGITVPPFDCDDLDATEPPRQGTSGSGPCEAPNVLNSQCDPGSHFHVLHRNVSNDGVYVVAHCRHKAAAEGNGPGEYGDVAVIQYNANSGATCFYQALHAKLPHNAPAPSSGDTSYWETPQVAANTNCVRCHDNGPLVRSPYLAQLGQVWPFYKDFGNTANPNRPNPPAEDKNYLPGTLLSDLVGVWNRSQPYSFVGLNFQSWEAYSVTNTADATCTNCHRMGISKKDGHWNDGSGTSLNFGKEATEDLDSGGQPNKLPHGKLVDKTSSPIWMMPGDFTASDTTKANAVSFQTCAKAITDGTALPSGCSAARFARGDTCPPPPTVVNGTTSSADPTSWKNSGKQPLGQPGGRPGFYFFTSIHGPFYQNSPWDPYMNTPPAVANPPWDPPTQAPTFRGSYLRIYIEPSGQWMLAWGLDATDIQNGSNNPPPPGGPGGAVDAVAFEQIDSVPDPKACGSSYYSITDHDGSQATTSATVDATAGTSAAFLSGLIGNVTRGSVVNGEGEPYAHSYLLVSDDGGATTLAQTHDNAPDGVINQWFTAESWGNSCANWQASAHYAVHSVTSYDDVVLTADVANTICYIDGIAGDWGKVVSDGNGGSIQPYAQIYIDATTGYHLKVSPSSANDPNRILATATCLYLKK